MPSRRPLLRLAAIAAAVLVAATLGPVATAGAHATLLSLTPTPDAMVDRPPEQVQLVFDEPVTVTDDSIRLFDPAARELPVEVTSEGVSVLGDPGELDLDGSYTVAWTVVSADGHPLSGAYLFHLREATLTAPVDVGSGGGSPAVDLLRSLGTAAALLGAAWVAFGLVRPRAARPGRGSRVVPWAVAAVGTAAALLGAVLAVGSDLAASLRAVLDTTSGVSATAALVIAFVGLGLGAVGPRGRGAARVGLGLVVALVVAVAAQGHAVSLEPVALSASMTVLHVVAAVVWIVGLVLLDRELRGAAPGTTDEAPGTTDEAQRTAAGVRRLSPVAAAAAGLLALSGVVLVLDRVPVGELATSGYGQLALGKAALLAVAVALAAANRFRIAPGLTDPDRAGAARTRLALGVRVEVVVVVLALLAGTVLAQVSPPGTGSDDPAGELDERRPFGGGEVELTIEPAQRGTNEVHVIALEPDGRLMGGIGELELAFSLPSEDVGPLLPAMQPITGGHSVAFADLPLTGTWQVEVTAPRGDFEELSAEFVVEVGD